jgi:hypothetical protein
MGMVLLDITRWDLKGLALRIQIGTSSPPGTHRPTGYPSSLNNPLATAVY